MTHTAFTWSRRATVVWLTHDCTYAWSVSRNSTDGFAGSVAASASAALARRWGRADESWMAGLTASIDIGTSG
jgi:hypothetical protein